jgi:two-component system response regulator FlrC
MLACHLVSRLANISGNTDMATDPASIDHRLTAPDPGAEPSDPVACDPSTVELLQLARRVATSDCTVLISGESGTGKEVVARYIHHHSPRRHAPFIAVNCAAIPEHMLEGMLFGWEKGAFTGAHAAHSGKFEQAQAGTLLLDEISEMPLALQAKLLRVLQEREVERLGGRALVTLDVRVLATTNRLLREEVAGGRFREDLYYRLNVIPLGLAPLRARRADVLPLAMRLLTSHSPAGGPIPALSAEAGQLLLGYDWPGNVRELDNVMQRALVLCDGEVILPEHISFEQLGARPLPVPPSTPVARAAHPGRAPAATVPADLAGTLATTEYNVILDALASVGGRRDRVASRLGISPRTLRYKLARMRAAGIDMAMAGRGA